MVEVIDYRVSRIVVLCKDCGQDVGLYPARHKCGIPTSEELSTESPSLNNSNSNSDSKISSNLKNNLEGYNLWNKFITSATAMYNAEGDSDNESEKDDWDGETHISRILREHYENKGGDLPDWLYDSDSKDSKHNLGSTNNSYVSQTERTSTKRQVLLNRNENKNGNFNPLLEVNYNRSHKNRSQPSNYHTGNASPVHTSAKMDRNRDKGVPPPNSFNRNNIQNDKYYENYSSPKISNYNSLPSRRQPQPLPTAPDNYDAARRLIPSKKSYNKLYSNYNDTFNKIGLPNRDIRVNNAQGVPLSSSRVPNRNQIQGSYF